LIGTVAPLTPAAPLIVDVVAATVSSAVAEVSLLIQVPCPGGKTDWVRVSLATVCELFTVHVVLFVVAVT
jgi:hypothetical protein